MIRTSINQTFRVTLKRRSLILISLLSFNKMHDSVGWCTYCEWNNLLIDRREGNRNSQGVPWRSDMRYYVRLPKCDCWFRFLLKTPIDAIRVSWEFLSNRQESIIHLQISSQCIVHQDIMPFLNVRLKYVSFPSKSRTGQFVWWVSTHRLISYILS